MSYLARFKKPNLFRVAFVFVGVIGASSGALTSAVHQSSQDRARVIDQVRYPYEPVTVTEVIWANKQIRMGNKFDGIAGDKIDGDADWLRDISFRVKNTSDKPITLIEIALYFPETRATGSLVWYQMKFGVVPGFPNLKQHPFVLKPGETFDVPLAPRYEQIRKIVSRQYPMAEIHRVEMQVRDVIFDDMTAWMMGSPARQDPANPRRYTSSPQLR